MADLQNLTFVRNGSITFSVPRFTVTCNITDTNSGVVLQNFDGTFPSATINARFTAQEIEDAFKEMYTKLIISKARLL